MRSRTKQYKITQCEPDSKARNTSTHSCPKITTLHHKIFKKNIKHNYTRRR